MTSCPHGPSSMCDSEDDEQHEHDDFHSNADVHVTHLSFLLDFVGVFRFSLGHGKEKTG